MSSTVRNALSSSAMAWLLIWVTNTMCLTLLNKALFQIADFQYPFFLSAFHMLINWIGAECVFWLAGRHAFAPESVFGSVTRKTLEPASQYWILAYSAIFSLNISFGNVSLKHVSVNFNQVMRSLSPAVTMLIGVAFFGKRFSFARVVTIVPVVTGVALACLGDMSYTSVGFFYTACCVLTAAVKAVASGELLTGPLQLHPVDLLARMSYLAYIQCILAAYFNGEIQDIIHRWSSELSPAITVKPMLLLGISAMAAFCFNVSSLQANKLTSPLTMCIGGNIMQVLMIIVATFLFNVNVSLLNGLGIVITLTGSAWYSYVSVMEKDQGKEQDAYEKVKLFDTKDDDDDDLSETKSSFDDALDVEFALTESSSLESLDSS